MPFLLYVWYVFLFLVCITKIKNTIAFMDMDCRKAIRKSGKKEHHLWIRKDSNGSGQKALNLVETVCSLFLSIQYALG